MNTLKVIERNQNIFYQKILTPTKTNGGIKRVTDKIKEGTCRGVVVWQIPKLFERI
jgi:hypothetical protein